MIRIFLSALLCSILYVPLVESSAQPASDIASPVQVVAAFQKFPHYELFCQDETWDSAEPIKVGAKFEPYLSKEMYKLFLWSQCGEPETLPHYKERGFEGVIYWDIRFGLGGALSSNTFEAGNIRVRQATYQGQDKAIVKVLFDPLPYDLKNITTIYTLIREDGHWKIDDIAPKGDFKPNDENYDAALEHSDSIKTDMQKNYGAAERRYQQEQAKKSAASKP